MNRFVAKKNFRADTSREPRRTPVVRSEKEKISDWAFPDWPGSGPHAQRAEDKRIFTILYPINEENSSLAVKKYIIQCDKKKVYTANGQFFYPKWSNDVTIVSMQAICNRVYMNKPEEDLLEQRWLQSTVHGHSSRRRANKDMDRCAQALKNEVSLFKYLRSIGQGVVDANRKSPDDSGPKIHIRLSKALIDCHDCDNSTAMMFGETSAMIALAAERTESLRTSHSRTTDQACGVIAVPLMSLVNKSADEALSLVKETIGENSTLLEVVRENMESNNIQFNSHFLMNFIEGLKEGGPWWAGNSAFPFPDENDKKFCPWISSDVHIDVGDISVLLVVWNWVDGCFVGLPGGTRTLGETSLECCLRQTEEETTIDLREAVIRATDQHSVTQDSIRGGWIVPLHLQLSLNCYVFSHFSLFRE